MSSARHLDKHCVAFVLPEAPKKGRSWIREEKGTQTQIFWSGYLRVGKPGKSNFLARMSWDFAGISRCVCPPAKGPDPEIQVGQKLRNTLSTGWNSTRSSERPSPEPLLKKKRRPQPYWGADNSGNALDASNALSFRAWGMQAVLSRGIPGKALRGLSGISSGKSQPHWGYGPKVGPEVGFGGSLNRGWLDDQGTVRWNWMEEVPRRTSRVPFAFLCFCLCDTSGSKGGSDFRGRRGIVSVVRWNPRPVIFGFDEHRSKVGQQ